VEDEPAVRQVAEQVFDGFSPGSGALKSQRGSAATKGRVGAAVES
jgi:hypothetical protein